MDLEKAVCSTAINFESIICNARWYIVYDDKYTDFHRVNELFGIKREQKIYDKIYLFTSNVENDNLFSFRLPVKFVKSRSIGEM